MRLNLVASTDNSAWQLANNGHSTSDSLHKGKIIQGVYRVPNNLIFFPIYVSFLNLDFLSYFHSLPYLIFFLTTLIF